MGLTSKQILTPTSPSKSPSNLDRFLLDLKGKSKSDDKDLTNELRKITQNILSTMSRPIKSQRNTRKPGPLSSKSKINRTFDETTSSGNKTTKATTRNFGYFDQSGGPAPKTKNLVNVEDLLIFENKLANILYGLRSGLDISQYCQEWWNLSNNHNIIKADVYIYIYI